VPPARPPDGVTLEHVLRGIKMSIATRVLKRWKQLNAPILGKVLDAAGRPRFWQKGGGFDRNVRNDSELMGEIRYIHRNPVTRGLVAAPELWPWSSVRWWMGQRDNELPCDPPPGRPESWAGWKGFM
jgi:putative transposase